MALCWCVSLANVDQAWERWKGGLIPGPAARYALEIQRGEMLDFVNPVCGGLACPPYTYSAEEERK